MKFHRSESTLLLCAYLAGAPSTSQVPLPHAPAKVESTAGLNLQAEKARTKLDLLRQLAPNPGGSHPGPISTTIVAEATGADRSGAVESVAGTPLPGTAVSQATGYAPSSTVAGDFNGDGHEDWAIAMYGDNTVWVYFGNGDGTWKTPEIIPLNGSGPIAMIGVDLRHSGKLDLVVAEAGSATVGVLLSNGDGTFQRELEHDLPDFPLCLVAGDFNGDGKLDIVTGNSSNAGVGPMTFLAGDGNGGLGAPVISNPHLYAGAVALAVGDFNKDGKLDLMVNGNTEFPPYDGVQVALGNGNGIFRIGAMVDEVYCPPNGCSYYPLTLVNDLDHDGCLDAIVINAYGAALIYRGKCNGTFETSPQDDFGLGDSIVSAQLADVNGDGIPDFIGGGAILYQPGNGAGGNSGNLIAVSLGNGKGGFSSEATVYRVDGNIFGLAVADLRHTGKPDIIAPSMFANTLAVLQNDGHGHFPAPQGSAVTYPSGGTSNSPDSAPLVADLNGDGKPDIALFRVPQYDGAPYTLSVLLQRPDGSFAPPVNSDLTVPSFGDSPPRGFAFGDFRGKGQQDAVILSSDQPYLMFEANLGGGKFGRTIVTYPPAANGLAAVGDFNHDGKLDFVAVGGSDSAVPAVTVFLGNGDGSFLPQSSVELPVSASMTEYGTPVSVFAADFNRDGKLDVLTEFENTLGQTEIYEAFGDGTGGFSATSLVGTGIPIAYVADLNHDGCPDIIAGDTATSRPGFSVYMCQQDGHFSAPRNFNPYLEKPAVRVEGTLMVTPPQPVTTDEYAPLVGDFDDDGNLDVALTEQDPLTLMPSMFYATGIGDGTFSQHLLRTPMGSLLGPEFVGNIRGKGVTGMVQLDKFTAAVTPIPGKTTHATFAIRFRALPISGGEAHLRLLLDAPAPQNLAFNLSADINGLSLPSTVEVPKGATFHDVNFALGSAFDFAHAFTITVTKGVELHQALGYAVNRSIAAIELTPAVFDFGNVDVGLQSASKTAKLTNFGSATMKDLDFVHTAEFDGDFTITGGTCGTELAAGTSCTFQFAATPPVFNGLGSAADPEGPPSRIEGSLIFSGDSGATSSWAWGYRIPIRTAIQAAPGALDFSATYGATSAPQSVKIVNSGSEPMVITSVEDSQATQDGFERTGDTCASPVPPHATCVLTYTFTGPEFLSPNRFSDPVILYGNFPDSAFSLNATVMVYAVELLPTYLEFPSTAVGKTAPVRQLMLSNSGSTTISLSGPGYGIAIRGSGTSSFLKTTSCAANLTPQGQCTINVTFKPVEKGNLNAELTVMDNASGSPQTVLLSGTGLAPQVNLSPASLTFAKTYVGKAAQAKKITLTNTGNAALTLSGVGQGISILGGAATSFTQINTCGASVAARESCAITVTFTPASAGTLNASLSIADTAAGSPQMVALTGTGIP